MPQGWGAEATDRASCAHRTLCRGGAECSRCGHWGGPQALPRCAERWLCRATCSTHSRSQPFLEVVQNQLRSWGDQGSPRYMVGGKGQLVRPGDHRLELEGWGMRNPWVGARVLAKPLARLSLRSRACRPPASRGGPGFLDPNTRKPPAPGGGSGGDHHVCSSRDAFPLGSMTSLAGFR